MLDMICVLLMQHHLGSEDGWEQLLAVADVLRRKATYLQIGITDVDV